MWSQFLINLCKKITKSNEVYSVHVCYVNTHGLCKCFSGKPIYLHSCPPVLDCAKTQALKIYIHIVAALSHISKHLIGTHLFGANYWTGTSFSYEKLPVVWYTTYMNHILQLNILHNPNGFFKLDLSIFLGVSIGLISDATAGLQGRTNCLMGEC